MPDLRVSRNKELNEIFVRAIDAVQAADYSLSENSLRFLLNEQIDQSDISKVQTAIEAAGKQIEAVESYLDKFGNLDRSKIDTVDSYIGSLKSALDKARSELSGASFETGAVSTFFGEKVTLPQIAQGAVALHTKATDFGTAFSDSINRVKAAVEPFAKDSDLDTPIRQLAGQGAVPEEAKMKKGIEKAIKTALGGGFFKKIVGFFSKARSGAEKRILDEIPDLDESAMASQMADALLDATINELTKTPPPPKPDTAKDLENVAQEAVKAEEEEAEQAADDPGADAVDTGGAPPPENEEEAEQEQDAASEELTSAVKDAGGDSSPPGVAVMDALDSWYDGLSPSSQQTLKAAGRYDSLKTTVQTTMDGLADTVEDAIKAAMADWRSEHEETLIKSRRFAKKNFDTLEQTVPQLAAFMIKKVEESRSRLTKSKIKKTVYSFLNKRFKPGLTGVLNERYTPNEMAVYRLNKLAGLDK